MQNLWSCFVNHPPFLSALAALVSAFFAGVSWVLLYKTWNLVQKKARPWLSIEDIQNEPFFGFTMNIKNTGEHPAGLLQIKCRYALMNKPEESMEAEDKKLSIKIPSTWAGLEQDLSFSDELAVGGCLPVSYKMLELADFVLLVQLHYQDVFTKKNFDTLSWHKHRYSQGMVGKFVALSIDEKKRFQPFFDRAV